jgi:hypothetical protein
LVGLETPESIIQYLLKQPLICGFGGYYINKLSEYDLAEFTKDMLEQLKIVSYRYRRYFFLLNIQKLHMNKTK